MPALRAPRIELVATQAAKAIRANAMMAVEKLHLPVVGPHADRTPLEALLLVPDLDPAVRDRVILVVIVSRETVDSPRKAIDLGTLLGDIHPKAIVLGFHDAFLGVETGGLSFRVAKFETYAADFGILVLDYGVLLLVCGLATSGIAPRGTELGILLTNLIRETGDLGIFLATFGLPLFGFLILFGCSFLQPRKSAREPVDQSGKGRFVRHDSAITKAIETVYIHSILVLFVAAILDHGYRECHANTREKQRAHHADH